MLCPDKVQMLLARQALVGKRHFDWIPDFGVLGENPLWGVHNKENWIRDWEFGPQIPKPISAHVGKPPTKKSNRDIWEEKFQDKIQKHNASARKGGHRKHIVEAETQREGQGPSGPKRDSARDRKIRSDKRHIQCEDCGQHIVQRSKLEWFLRQLGDGSEALNRGCQ